MQGSKPNGVLTFTGDLFSVKGVWFGAVPFDPTKVAGVKVGTMTWQKQSGVPGTLTYSVNGVNVTKSLTRQLIGTDNYSGPYLASIHFVATGCLNPAMNGTTDSGSTLTIAQNGSAISLTLVDVGCTIVGTYSQSGQYGDVSGTYSCSSGDKGTFDLSNMIVTPFAMTGQASAEVRHRSLEAAVAVGR